MTEGTIRPQHWMTMFVTALLLFALGGTGHAGTTMNWANALGGVWRDQASAVQFTGDGGCILAGSTWSFDQATGYGDAWIVKLHQNGRVQWQRSYGDTLWDELHSIRQTADGGYVAAGTSYPPDTSQEAWVMKLGDDGGIAWQQTYGRDDHYDGALQVRPTIDGGFIVAAWTQPYTISGRQQPWVFKLDASGGIEWQQVFAGSHLDLLFAVEQTTDGGYVLAGGSYSHSASPGLYSDVWVMKLGADGSVDWQKSYGGSYDEVAYAIRPTSDGGYIVAAWSDSFGSGYGDVWVLKLDVAGNIVWQESLGGSQSDVPMALWTAPDDGIVIAGYTASFGAGGFDGWILALAADGAVRWQKTYGSAMDDLFLALDGAADGFAAAGRTRSCGAGEEDLWVVRTQADGSLPRYFLTADSAALASATDAGSCYIQALPAATAVVPGPSAARAMPTRAKVTTLHRLVPPAPAGP